MNLYEDCKRKIYDLINFVHDKSIKVCEETNQYRYLRINYDDQ